MRNSISLAVLSLFTIVASAQVPNVLWTNSAGANRHEYGNAITIDSSSNCYLTGTFTSALLTLDSITLTNASNSGTVADAFLIKYDTSGHVMWAKNYGGSGQEIGNAMCSGHDNDIYFAGTFSSDTIHLDSFSLANASTGFADIFLARIDTAGNIIWAKQFGGNKAENVRQLTMDVNGNLLLTGEFWSSTITLGTSTYTNTSNSGDMLTMKLDTSGNVIWAITEGGTNIDFGETVGSDLNGNVYVTGNFQAPSITIGTVTLTSAGSNEIYLAKYDSNGNFIWAKNPQGDFADYGFGCTDGDGNTYMSGNFTGDSIVFDTISLYNNTPFPLSGNIFWAKFDSAGTVLIAETFAGDHDEIVAESFLDNAGNTYMAGGFSSNSLLFGNVTLSNSQSNYTQDMFVSKLDSLGNVVYAFSAVGTGYENTNAIVANDSGRVWFSVEYNASMAVWNSDTLIGQGLYDFYTTMVEGVSIITGENNQDLLSSDSLKIFPNPGTGRFNIASAEKGCQADIYDLTGKLVHSLYSQEKNFTLDLTGMPAGIYFLQLVTENGSVHVAKLIVRSY